MCDSQLRGLAMAGIRNEMISLLDKLKMEADTAIELIRQIPDDTLEKTADCLLSSLNGIADVVGELAEQSQIVALLCIGGDKHDTR